jgi:hypothetical protein
LPKLDKDKFLDHKKWYTYEISKLIDNIVSNATSGHQLLESKKQLPPLLALTVFIKKDKLWVSSPLK